MKKKKLVQENENAPDVEQNTTKETRPTRVLLSMDEEGIIVEFEGVATDIIKKLCHLFNESADIMNLFKTAIELTESYQALPKLERD